jgi:aromatic-L-amino-acid/L-tryptophan decarboxylase
VNPGEFREVGHRVVDLLAEYLEHIEEKPVFPNIEPSTLTQLFAEPLPQDPSSPEKVLGELEQKLLPYCTHVGHPGYMGLITPSPNPIGIIADFICSALNQDQRQTPNADAQTENDDIKQLISTYYLLHTVPTPYRVDK